jgi:orfb protein
MLAKFEIILDKEEILKIYCIGKVKEEKIEDEKERLKRHGFIETEINYFKKRDIVIIFEETSNLKNSDYKHLCLDSAFKRYIQGREIY